MPNRIKGEVPKAIIQLKPDYKPSPELAEEIIKWCKERLASFKVPREVEFRSTLPLTPIGKVWRNLLKQEKRKSTREDERERKAARSQFSHQKPHLLPLRCTSLRP
ncbi:MAG: AMP-binding enzyme [Candidatus Baldrarchaeia archaeon]